MTGLLGPDGNPISSSQYKKVAPPVLGEKLGAWAGEEVRLMALPGGGAIQFDLSRLTLTDFRQMKDHYQINSSLAVLTFLLHQMEWHIECEDEKVATFCQENLEEQWTRLVRAKSQAFWAGFSPNVIQWDNDLKGRRVVIDKIKDLYPEDCRVNWKIVEGSAPGTNVKPKIKIYDGINQFGWPKPIPVENTYWYPLLMENGDYYGRKLLRPAFQSWFFSILLHLFANRYYERFGEPTPIARAPFEDTVEMEGNTYNGRDAMGLILQQLRNRSTVVLPNDRTPIGDETNPEFDYQIEYLESQMRGADFERYLTRLDEEMSLALFTPILIMRTAEVGSYNLGVQHNLIYQMMINAISGDWKTYIDKYLLRPLRDYNFGTNAALPTIRFRRLGKENAELVRDIFRELMSSGKIKFDLRELGEMTGMTVEEVEEVADLPSQEEEPEPEAPPSSDNSLEKIGELIFSRATKQIKNAYRKYKLGELRVSLGYHRQFEEALVQMGYSNAHSATRSFYERMDLVLLDLRELGEVFPTEVSFLRQFRSVLFSEIAAMRES